MTPAGPWAGDASVNSDSLGVKIRAQLFSLGHPLGGPYFDSSKSPQPEDQGINEGSGLVP